MWIRTIILVAFLANSALALNARELLEKSRQLYVDAGAFSAKFQQTVSSGDFFDDEETTGMLLMVYPDKFRIDTPEQVITCDGDSLWSYSAENKQVTIDAVTNVDDFVTPADYLFEFREKYQVAGDSLDLVDSAGVFQLSLRAKDSDHFVQTLQLFIDSRNYAVRNVVYDDINDNRISIEFFDLKLNLKLEAGRFRFQTPSGVEEVRLP